MSTAEKGREKEKVKERRTDNRCSFASCEETSHFFNPYPSFFFAPRFNAVRLVVCCSAIFLKKRCNSCNLNSYSIPQPPLSPQGGSKTDPLKKMSVLSSGARWGEPTSVLQRRTGSSLSRPSSVHSSTSATEKPRPTPQQPPARVRKVHVKTTPEVENLSFHSSTSSLGSLANSSAGLLPSMLLPTTPPPPTLWLSTTDTTPHAIFGMYTLESEPYHGMPVWGKGSFKVYSDSRDRWKVIGGEGMGRDVGMYMADGGAHGGGLPHGVSGWLRYERGEWKSAPEVGISAERATVNNSGYIYIVGRTHGKHRCKQCTQVVVPGDWFRCNVCQDSNECDLCASCFNSGTHQEHQFTSMDYPSFIPGHLLPDAQPSKRRANGRVDETSKKAFHEIADNTIVVRKVS